MKNGFRQKTSFIQRLRFILLIIAAFFVLGIMSLYVSSQGFLTGLQDISHANRILGHTSTTLQALETSQERLVQAGVEVTTSSRVTIQETAKIANQHITAAIELSGAYPKVHAKLKEAELGVSQYLSSVNAFTDVSKPAAEEILIAREFINDSQDDLRSAQIILRSETDEIFNRIYKNRFKPLIVAGLLSTAFFAFVVIVGFANSRKLGNSLRNLTHATDAVAAGDFSYQAQILEADEFGKLTYEFNEMVSSLKDKQARLNETMDKLTRLQSITNSFSSVLLPEEIFDVIVMDVHRSIRADAGSLSIVTEDGEEIENLTIGYKQAPSRVKRDWHSPMTLTLNSGTPHFYDDVDVLREQFPNVYDLIVKSGVVSTAYLPLVVGKQVYGVLTFGFKIPRHFSDTDKEFMVAMTQQCAQAFHRAKLYKASTDAIHIRDEFLSIASHELRTPLTPLKLQLQNMSRQVKKGQIKVTDQDQVLKIVDSSDRQVDRLINLIDDLLDVSRISAGKLTLNYERFNFGEMVEEVINHYSAHLKEAQSFLTSDVDKTVVCVADRVRMEQVLINLLTNAMKYAPKKPVRVEFKNINGLASLSVSDQGQGITPENQKRIFDRFERVRDKNNIGGLGLGLYICRQIVEAHNGKIRVSSTPGEGSVFTVEIPALS